jgi:hypothetical protein
MWHGGGFHGQQADRRLSCLCMAMAWRPVHADHAKDAAWLFGDATGILRGDRPPTIALT